MTAPASTTTSTSAAAPATSQTTTTATVAPSSTATGSATGNSSDKGQCGATSADKAFADAVSQVPPPQSGGGQQWTMAPGSGTGYDACGALSWIVASASGGTAASPYAILLFHNGTFVGTATSKAYPFEPDVSRKDDKSIQVAYKYAKSGDANANPTGKATATFTWNDAQGKVVQSGELPPEQ